MEFVKLEQMMSIARKIKPAKTFTEKNSQENKNPLGKIFPIFIV